MSLSWNKTDLPTIAEKKITEIAETCQRAIYAGIDVELSAGKQHFSLEPNDQTNIDSMFMGVLVGASEYPYHSDGNQCVMFSAADIISLYVAYKSFVTRQTTYCNAMMTWLRRETDRNVVASIHYGSELPDDLAAEMNAVLAKAAEQVQTIIEKMGQR